MKSSRLQGALSLPKILVFIVAGTVLLSFLFFTFWQRLNQKVEDILKEQFNQQQLELARKIADNVEAYFDYLESELLAYPWRFRLIPLTPPTLTPIWRPVFKICSVWASWRFGYTTGPGVATLLESPSREQLRGGGWRPSNLPSLAG
jgi:hypothetical protein